MNKDERLKMQHIFYNSDQESLYNASGSQHKIQLIPPPMPDINKKTLQNSNVDLMVEPTAEVRVIVDSNGRLKF